MKHLIWITRILFSRSILVSYAMILNACVFIPEHKPSDISSCRLSTPEWELSSLSADQAELCRGTGSQAGALCLAGLGIVLPAGSFLVSGSIVVTGNTLHWLEYQGRCDDSTLNKAIAKLSYN